MMAHRPLSNWVITVGETPPDGGAWERSGEVNDGDERADARHLTEFAAGWHRRTLRIDPIGAALGLVHDETGRNVVELNQVARPVPVGQTAVEIVSGLEDRWPADTISASELNVLAGEDVFVRHLLLSRLAREGSPAPEIFHILPWHLVDDAVDAVTAMLSESGDVPKIRLRYYFASAGSRFTAALEQIDGGLRQRDSSLYRVGATRLCSRLLDLDVSRVPVTTRQHLHSLVEVLLDDNPFLQNTANQVFDHLNPPAQAITSRPPAHLDSRLAPAADAGRRIRRQSAEVVREPFVLRLDVTSTGRAEVTVRAPLPENRAAWLVDSYGVTLVPIVVLGTEWGRNYFVVLTRENDTLVGNLDLPITPGEQIQADLSGPPIGAAEVPLLPEEEVRRSIQGATTRSDRRLWLSLVAGLPPGHRLRAAVEEETRSR